MKKIKKYKVLISAPYLQREFDIYKDQLITEDIECFLPKVIERLEENELLKIIEEIDGVICGDDRFTRVVLDKAKNLKVIVKWGTGIDSIDEKYAESKGIPVCNTPGAFTEPVSDTVIGLMLVFSRRLLDSDRLMKNNGWDKPLGRTLGECSLGIIGIGSVGRAVARKAKGFGMKIYGNDIIKISDDVVDSLGIEMLDLKELLSKADFVSLNCDLNPTSFHLMGMEEFKSMQRNAYLINTARGGVVKEMNLIEALKNREIAGAGLDVFEKEPLAQSSSLRDMENVILSSHNSNSSPLYWEKVHKRSIKLLKEHLNKGG